MSQPFRFVPPAFQFLIQSAIQVLAGGKLFFYQSGTSTPQATYTDPTLVTPNPNPVQLNASGMPEADIWMSGNYRVVLEDVNGNVQWTYDNVEIPGGQSQAIPSLSGQSGNFLTTDGTNLLWSPIVQLPSQTGQSGKYLSTNGTSAAWSAIPTNTVTASASGKIVNGAVTDQWGTATLPATGTHTTIASVTFGTAFSGVPYAISLVQTQGSGVTSAGGMLILAALSQSASGFSLQGDINDFGSISAGIIRTTTVQWRAIGPT